MEALLLSPVLVFSPTAAGLLTSMAPSPELVLGAGFVVLAGFLVGCISAAQDASRALQRRHGLQHRLHFEPRGAWPDSTPIESHSHFLSPRPRQGPASP
jgi:hypothetical protein